MKRWKLWAAALAGTAALLLSACGSGALEEGTVYQAQAAERKDLQAQEFDSASAGSGEAAAGEGFSLADIPAYSGEPYVAVHGNVPYFESTDLTAAAFESYSELDSLGRCGIAYASIGRELMPTEKRGEIGQVKPSGWHSVKYEGVDGNYLYNRCHLIGYQLTAENANERNLITGTRYMNTIGMLPFENLTADYIKETDNHVLYRVTPVFEGNNLVASGVLMEAESVEDQGEGVLFCVYVYNVQPGITIDYATGDSERTGDTAAGTAGTDSSGKSSGAAGTSKDETESTYVLNTSSKKFHKPSCSGALKMSESNKKAWTGKRSELIDRGYSPCGLCNP